MVDHGDSVEVVIPVLVTAIKKLISVRGSPPLGDALLWIVTGMLGVFTNAVLEFS